MPQRFSAIVGQNQAETRQFTSVPISVDAKCITLSGDDRHRSACRSWNTLILPAKKSAGADRSGLKLRRHTALASNEAGGALIKDCNEVVMKRVIFAVLLTALALFLFVPSLSWAF